MPAADTMHPGTLRESSHGVHWGVHRAGQFSRNQPERINVCSESRAIAGPERGENLGLTASGGFEIPILKNPPALRSQGVRRYS